MPAKKRGVPTTSERVITFEELMDCHTKEEFERVLLGAMHAIKDNEHCTNAGDYAFYKRECTNAMVCFTENLKRFVDTRQEYVMVKAHTEVHPEDLNAQRRYMDTLNALQNYTTKLQHHLRRIQRAKVRMSVIEKGESICKEAIE